MSRYLAVLAGLVVPLWGAAPGMAASVIKLTGPGPFTITQPGNYLLTNDITVASGETGIIVRASNVHLDLGGHSLTGPGGDRALTTTGIIVWFTADSVHINNGTIEGMATGVIVSSTNGSIDSLSLTNNFTGIDVNGSNNNLVGNSFTGNNKGVILETIASSNTVTGNYFTGGTDEIHLGGGSLGSPSGDKITGNTISAGDIGVNVETGAQFLIQGNHFTNCTRSGSIWARSPTAPSRGTSPVTAPPGS
jgi:parallel beta-helix repeat protein